MQVLKHGYLNPRYFVCPRCCCEFVADMSEYESSASGENYFVRCPDCDHEFDQHAPLYKEA